jgi:hypothetical protein
VLRKEHNKASMSEIRFWRNPVPLKRMDIGFSNYAGTFQSHPVQKIYCSQSND